MASAFIIRFRETERFHFFRYVKNRVVGNQVGYVVSLRGLPGVSDSLRDKITQVAKQKGYLRDNAADPTAESAVITVSMICRKSFFEDPTFWSQVFYGIGDYSGQNNITIRTVTIDIDENDANILSSIANCKSGGYIVVGTIRDDLLYKIIEMKTPVIVVDYYSKDIPCDYINTDNSGGIYKAVKYLYQNNHRKIGFINNQEGAYSFARRYEAYRRYMELFKMPVEERFVWHDAVYSDTIYYKQKIQALRSLSSFPTAWICVNDNTAIAFYNALMELGIKVPNEVSIIGFDNIVSSYKPFITTIDVPQKAIGWWAMQQLHDRIKYPDKPFVSIQLNTTLVERNTVKYLK